MTIAEGAVLDQLHELQTQNQEIRAQLSQVLKLLGKRTSTEKIELSRSEARKLCGCRNEVLISALEAGEIAGARRVPRGATSTWRIPRESVQAWQKQQAAP